MSWTTVIWDLLHTTGTHRAMSQLQGQGSQVVSGWHKMAAHAKASEQGGNTLLPLPQFFCTYLSLVEGYRLRQTLH